MNAKILNLVYISRTLTIMVLTAYMSIAIRAENVQSTPRQNSDPTSNADSDTLRLIDEIALKLDNEITSPSSNVRNVGSYLSISQQKVRKFIFELEAMGASYADYIYRLRSEFGGAASSALTISLGLMQDPRVHDDVSRIVLEETDPGLRGIAVRALSGYMDTLDVPAFIQALSDTNTVVMELDVDAPDGEFSKRVAIVSVEASPALYKFGYEIKMDTINGSYEVVKREDVQK